MCIINPDNTS